MDFYNVDINRTLVHFSISEAGLSSQEAKKRLEKYGKNLLEEEKTNKLEIFFRQLKDPIVAILLIAAIIAFFIGNDKDFYLIIIIIIVNTIIGFSQELKAEISIKSLRKLTESKITVLRDNVEESILSSLVVPGDIVLLKEGDIISADIRLIKTIGFFADESTVTGESLPVQKNAELVLPENAMPYELENMALSGTAVTKGSAKGVVVKTGKESYLAKIAERIKEKSPATPLTKAIKSFSRRYLISVIILLFVMGIIGFLQGRSAIDMAYILIAQLVSAVPAGLPIVLTLVLAFGSVFLSKKCTLVRQLPAVETLGSATIIASDKTGTITEGKLTVQDVYALNDEDLKLAAALCNESEQGRGDPLDLALAVWLKDDYNKLRNENPLVFIYPFDASRKYVATVNKYGDSQRVYIKGAFESLSQKTINTEVLEVLEKEHNLMAENGLRVIAFGISSGCESDPETCKIRLVGLVGFLDPTKKGVKEAVVIARKAGIRTIMITGDNPITARAIARDAGICQNCDRVLTGLEIEKISDDALLERLKITSVIARAIPEHKYRIVKLLQNSGEIVAVTGDGVNDVPALKIADLGIAMGRGTEAAKSVSKMIIINDNLSVIVEAIRQGRVIADNIRKVIFYLVTTSLCEVSIIFLSILLGLPLPLYPAQILWVNIVTDGVQDKTFAFIKEEGDTMARPPKRPETQFFNAFQIKKLVFSTFIISAINFGLFAYMLNKKFPYSEIVTTVFTLLVISQWINGIQAQKDVEPFFYNIKRSITINPYIWISVLVGVLLQVTAIYYLHDLLRTVPLSLIHFQMIFMASILIFALLEAQKWFYFALYRKNPEIL